MTAQLEDYEPTAAPVRGLRAWPTDLLILCLLTTFLWGVTFAWYVFDLNRLLDPPLKSERDAWIAALTGLIFFYFLLLGIVSSWGAILGLPTCLTVIQLFQRKHSRKRRWLVSSLITAMLFFGIPIAIDREGESEISAAYQSQDAVNPPQTAGRAVEFLSQSPMPATWHEPLSCDNHCLDMLTFGRATSVTRSFPYSEKAPESGPYRQTFRLGRVGQECRGARFRSYCGILSDEPLPRSRLVIQTLSVPQVPGMPKVTARRMEISDTETGGLGASLTQFEFAHTSSIMNISIENGRIALARDGLPILVEDTLDKQLFRRLIANRVLDGRTYPFR